MTKNRHGLMRSWSGAVDAAKNNFSISTTLGPGSISRFGKMVCRVAITWLTMSS
jgi:hypothetical protein